MKYTNHAIQRSQERTLSQDELELLNVIGFMAEQKDGCAIITVAKHERNKWISVLKELLMVLRAIKTDQDGQRYLKRKLKAAKRLLGHLQAACLPYFVIKLEEDLVITCGYRNQKLKHNF